MEVNDAGELFARTQIWLIMAANQFMSALICQLDFCPGDLETIFAKQLGS